MRGHRCGRGFGLQDTGRPQHANDIGASPRPHAEQDIGGCRHRGGRIDLVALPQAAGAHLDLRAHRGAGADPGT